MNPYVQGKPMSCPIKAQRLWPFAKQPSRRRGVSCVEFAVLSPLLLLLILGIIDLGQFINVGQSTSNASREGARVAVRRTTTNVSKVQTAVTNYMTEMHPGLPSSAVQVNVFQGANAVTGGDIATVAEGVPVTVQVTVQFEPGRWLKGLPFLNNRTLTNSSIMRRE